MAVFILITFPFSLFFEKKIILGFKMNPVVKLMGSVSNLDLSRTEKFRRRNILILLSNMYECRRDGI